MLNSQMIEKVIATTADLRACVGIRRRRMCAVRAPSRGAERQAGGTAARLRLAAASEPAKRCSPHRWVCVCECACA